MLYVKTTNDQPVEFPYTIGQFRRDHPNTAFPKHIPDTMLRRYSVFRVLEVMPINCNPLTQTLERDDMPHREVIRLKTEDDATDAFTGEVDQAQVGQPVYGYNWVVDYTVVDKPQSEAERAVRKKRDDLLQDTDWMALSDVEMSAEMTAYRQALRDITEQSGFPYNVAWPTKF